MTPDECARYVERLCSLSPARLAAVMDQEGLDTVTERVRRCRDDGPSESVCPPQLGTLSIAVTEEPSGGSHVSITFMSGEPQPTFTLLPPTHSLVTLSITHTATSLAQLQKRSEPWKGGGRGSVWNRVDSVEYFNQSGGEQCGAVALWKRRTAIGKHTAFLTCNKYTTYRESCSVVWHSANSLTVHVGKGPDRWLLRLCRTTSSLPKYTPSRVDREKFYGDVKKDASGTPWHLGFGAVIPACVATAMLQPSPVMTHAALRMKPLTLLPLPLLLPPPPAPPPPPPPPPLPPPPPPPPPPLPLPLPPLQLQEPLPQPTMTGEPKWVCAVCTFVNPALYLLCGACTMPAVPWCEPQPSWPCALGAGGDSSMGSCSKSKRPAPKGSGPKKARGPSPSIAANTQDLRVCWRLGKGKENV